MEKESNNKERAQINTFVSGLKSFVMVTLVCFIVFFGFLELVLRWKYLYSPQQWNYRKGFPVIEIDPEVPIEMGLKPNIDMLVRTIPGRSFKLKTNSLRLRDDDEFPLAKPKDHFRVIAMGDSWTFGEGVNIEDTYIKEIERRLIERGSPEYVYKGINCGYATGRAPDSAYVFLRNKGIRLNPDVVILGSYINDTFDIHYNNWHDPDSDGLPTRIDSDIFNVDDEGNFAYNYERQNIRSRFSLKPPKFKFLENSYAYVFFRFLYFKLYFFKYVFPKEELINNPFSGRFEPDWDRYFKVVEGIKRICDRNNAKLLVLFIPHLTHEPDREETLKRYKRGIENRFRAMNVNWLDLNRPFFDEVPIGDADAWEKFFIKNDGHWNENGHRLAGKLISDELFRLGWVPGKTD